MKNRRKAKPMGRPTLPLESKKRHGVLVKFNDGEYAALQAKAQRQPLASFLRELALAG